MSHEVSLIPDDEQPKKLELVKDFNERRFPLKEFMSDLLKTAVPDPKNVAILPIEAHVDSRIESTSFVDGQKVKNEEEIKSEKVAVETRFLKEKTMYASFESAATINLGNFNMGKVKVSLSMPVGTEITPELVQKMNSTYDFMKSWCETKLTQEVKELLELRNR